MRPDSYIDNGLNNGYLPNRAKYPRTASEPQFNSGGVYPSPGAQQSYENVTTTSGSSDPAGYTTDPSSENSSIDRMQAVPREPVDNYGFNGFGNIHQFATPGANENAPTGAQRQGSGYPNQAGPPTQVSQTAGSRAPIKLGTPTGGPSPVPAPQTKPAVQDKRKSWLGRRFSKADK